MRAERLRLAAYRGMATSEFTHETNKLHAVVNFKQTENGLEMRNSEYYVQNGVVQGRVVSGRHNVIADETGNLFYILDEKTFVPIGKIDLCDNIVGALDYKGCFVGNKDNLATYFGIRSPILVRQSINISSISSEDKRFVYVFYDPNSGWAYDYLLAPATTAQKNALGLLSKMVIDENIIATDFLQDGKVRIKTPTKNFVIDRAYNITNQNNVGTTAEAHGNIVIQNNVLKTLSGNDIATLPNNISFATEIGDYVFCISNEKLYVVNKTNGSYTLISYFTTVDDFTILGYDNNRFLIVILGGGDFDIYWLNSSDWNNPVEVEIDGEMPILLDWVASYPKLIEYDRLYNSFWTWNEDEASEYEVLLYNNELKINKIHSISFSAFINFEMIEEIVVGGGMFSYPLNLAPQAPIRPYFGFYPGGEYQYQVYLSDVSDYNFDMHVVYETFTSQFAIDNTTAIARNPIVSVGTGGNPSYAWKEFVVYVLPAPQFDVNIQKSVLVIGDYDTAGKYVMKSYAIPYGDVYKQKEFSPNNSPENIVVFNLFSGGTIQQFKQNVATYVYKGNPVLTFETLPDAGTTFKIRTSEYTAGSAEGGLDIGTVYSLKARSKYSFSFTASSYTNATIRIMVLDGNNVIKQENFSLTPTYKSFFMDFEIGSNISSAYKIVAILQTAMVDCYFRNIELKIANNFTEDFYWTILDEIAGEAIDFETINNYQALAFNDKVCFSVGGVISFDEGNNIVSENIIGVAASNAGFLVGTDKTLYLVSSVQEGTNFVAEMKRDGIDNKKQIDGAENILAWVGKSSSGVVVNGELLTDGTEVKKLLDNAEEVLVDTVNMRVYFLLDTDFFDDIVVDFMINNERVVYNYNAVVLFYDLKYRGWYVFGYNTRQDNSMVSLARIQKHAYGLLQLPDDGLSIMLLETNDDFSLPIVGHIRTREMGFGNPYQQKLLYRVLFDNTTKRPIDDVQKVNYWNIKISQYLSDNSSEEIITEKEIVGIDGNSCLVNVAANIYTAGISVTMTRMAGENPKLLLKDIVLFIQDMPRSRERTW